VKKREPHVKRTFFDLTPSHQARLVKSQTKHQHMIRDHHYNIQLKIYRNLSYTSHTIRTIQKLAFISTIRIAQRFLNIRRYYQRIRMRVNTDQLSRRMHKSPFYQRNEAYSY